MTEGSAVEVADPRAPIVAGTLMRYRFVWTGGGIGTGYTTLFGGGAGAQAFADAASAFVSAIVGSGVTAAIPATVTITPDGFVDLIDIPTGALTDSQGITPAVPITSTSSIVYAAPSGMCVTWTTAGVLGGKRVRGRTFFVPLVTTKYDTQGTLLDSFRTTSLAAAAIYRVGTWQPGIYHRAVHGAGGSWFPITGHGIKDRVSFLSSRR